MKTEMGEYIVGAYLKLIEKCDIIDYNVKPPEAGLKGLEELDVLGINLKTSTSYLCEVTTHITGLLYVDKTETINRIVKKHNRQLKYADKYLSTFKNHRYMFWSPVVNSGYVLEKLLSMTTLEVIINNDYSNRITELKQAAKSMTQEINNPAFRVLQILEHLKS